MQIADKFEHVDIVCVAVCVSVRCGQFTDVLRTGFGFLTFELEDSVDRVVNEHFIQISGKQVAVIVAYNICMALNGLLCDGVSRRETTDRCSYITLRYMTVFKVA